ncbi:MAG: RepB family plasmid replication initiator protein [Spartobacteria bacterium]|jgi:plasmid replication initiation protein|nr:RepB family plasmid replication initiator protein [Spartobacteria bacterium]
MREKQLMLPGPTVKKSNAAARAAWTADSVYEPRLLALVVSQIKTTDEDFRNYSVSVDDLIKEEGGKDHKYIFSIVKSLQGKQLIFNEDGEDITTSVFSFCSYNRQKRTITARFDPFLKPHYLSLKEGLFTQYSLFEFLMLPSVYSQRVFELLKSWDDKPEIILELDNLYKILDVPDSHKKDFRNFRIRVLEKAYKDIHKHTSLKYEWEPIKKGRAVCGIKFTFSKKRATVVAKKQKEEKQQKQSATNNKIFTKALDCLKKCNGKCSPQDCDMCKLCQKLHWPTKQMRLPI